MKLGMIEGYLIMRWVIISMIPRIFLLAPDLTGVLLRADILNLRLKYPCQCSVGGVVLSTHS